MVTSAELERIQTERGPCTERRAKMAASLGANASFESEIASAELGERDSSVPNCQADSQTLRARL